MTARKGTESAIARPELPTDRKEVYSKRAMRAQGRAIRNEMSFQAISKVLGAWFRRDCRALDFDGVVGACGNLFDLPVQFRTRVGSDGCGRRKGRADVGQSGTDRLSVAVGGRKGSPGTGLVPFPPG